MSCVFCLDTGGIHQRQVLLRGEQLYVCAPRGQLIEGYLVIAPYKCVGSFSRLPPDCLAELPRLAAAVTAFYDRAYGEVQATFYEQGRAGGGARVDPAGGFPLHAHLCCLPGTVDLHAVLGATYDHEPVTGIESLPAVVPLEPYVYVEACGSRRVYTAPAGSQRRAGLERMRLKPAVAALLGLPGRGNWREHPGDEQLERLIERWSRTWTRTTPSRSQSSHEPSGGQATSRPPRPRSNSRSTPPDGASPISTGSWAGSTRTGAT